jgi:hypothetical protein
MTLTNFNVLSVEYDTYIKTILKNCSKFVTVVINRGLGNYNNAMRQPKSLVPFLISFISIINDKDTSNIRAKNK